ncbi:atlastin-3 isoform X3 [Rhipicephalus microplus]|uniref:atlastin-3 isoform X3 n=1 Tax=Rhipicephalus microplus TaxID=6941 RepID=UPI003F6C97DB
MLVTDGHTLEQVPKELRLKHSGLSSQERCTTDDAVSGEPVQILRIEGGETIVFDERALESILLADHVKDRSVVVISIAGAYRQGKSFLLNFLLTHLRHNGRSKWIEETDTPLRGFQWRPGSTRETAGILLWNEVFLMTNSDGEKVAVLLMDTQGTFDCESTMKESTVIFSLSLMASSVQIYNIMSNIKENDLQHLQFFAEYGRLAQEDNKTQAFQKLLFLVRDWNWAHEFECGFQGGTSLMTSRLKTTSGQAAELKTLRQNILSSFSDLDCFLMPHPGKKAHVDVFKGGYLPNPTSMLTATANALNMAAKLKASTHYMSGMTRRPLRDLNALGFLHREMLTRAKTVFDEFPKVGGEAMSLTYKDDLIKELEGLFSHFYERAEEFIRIEREAEEKREKERQEERKKEWERERERTAQKAKAEAREKEIERDRKEFKDRETILLRQVLAREASLKKLKEEADREIKQEIEKRAKLRSEMERKRMKIGQLEKGIGNTNTEIKEAAIQLGFQTANLAAGIIMLLPGGVLPGSIFLAGQFAFQLSFNAVRARRKARERRIEMLRRFSPKFSHHSLTEEQRSLLYAILHG